MFYKLLAVLNVLEHTFFTHFEKCFKFLLMRVCSRNGSRKDTHCYNIFAAYKKELHIVFKVLSLSQISLNSALYVRNVRDIKQFYSTIKF